LNQIFQNRDQIKIRKNRGTKKICYENGTKNIIKPFYYVSCVCEFKT